MTALIRRGVAVVALQQIALAAVLFLLLVCWLQIPDANAFEIAASVVVALVMATAAGVGESAIALRLAGRQVTAKRLALGACCVVLAALLWLAVSSGLDYFAAKQALWAGYLNSRFPAALRNVFSYSHLFLWMTWLVSALGWIAAGVLAAVAFAVTVCDAPARGVPAIFRSARYWLALLVFVVAAAVLTCALLSWTPGHGFTMEAASLLLRIVCVVLVNALAVAWLFASMAAAVLRVQPVGMDDPVTSQLRTDSMP